MKQNNYYEEPEESSSCYHCGNETDGDTYCSTACKQYDLEWYQTAVEQKTYGTLVYVRIAENTQILQKQTNV